MLQQAAAGNDREEDWHFDGPSNILFTVTDGLFPRRELIPAERNMNNRGILSIAPTWVVSMILALDSMLK